MYDKFKELIDAKGITEYRVAKDLGFSMSLFPNWRTGKSTPKADKIQKIADYFGVPVSYFYEEENIGETKNGHNIPYYIDEDVAQIAQELHDDPNMRGLFSAVRNLSKEDILKFKEIIERYERGYDDD